MTTYKIGTTQPGLVTLKSLGIPDPLPSYEKYSQYELGGDGLEVGRGWGLAVWKWGFLTMTQRAALRVYIANVSTNLVIRMPDDSKTDHDFTAQAFWPKRETRSGNKTIDFQLEFHLLAQLVDL